MGHTVGKSKTVPGTFEYELWSGFETIETRGGFTSMAEATRAAEAAQRAYLFPVPADALTLDEILSDDELLSALFDVKA